MAQRIVQVDAFTDRPFTGNPAAVCVLTEPPQEWWLQDVAREMNLSETAFLIPHEDGYDLRWFTPTTEVELCGHATLASAHVLWEDGHLKPDEAARFHTHSGEITARRAGDWIDMDFPSEPPVEEPAGSSLRDALGADPVWVGRNRFDLLVQLADEKVVRTLSPDLRAIRALPARGVIVTSAPIAPKFDFVSRYFAPRAGVDEDPVTGSAHCALAPFWAERLDKNEMVGYQVSPRGGTVRVRLEGDRVIVSGQAVTVMRGDLI